MPFCARSPPGGAGQHPEARPPPLHAPSAALSAACGGGRARYLPTTHGRKPRHQEAKQPAHGYCTFLALLLTYERLFRPRLAPGHAPLWVLPLLRAGGMEAAACGAPAPPSLTPAARGKCFLVLPTLGAVPPCTLGITSWPPREAGGFPGGAPPLSQPCRREVFFCAASFSHISSRPGCVYPGVCSRVCVTAWLSVSSSV